MVLLWLVVDSISVIIVIWTGKHRRFRKQKILKFATQWDFHLSFYSLQRHIVPGANIIWMWVKRMEETGSMLKTRKHRWCRYVKTSENVQLLRAGNTFHSKAFCLVRNVRSKCEEDSQVRVRGLVSYIPKTKGKLWFQQDGTTAHAPKNSVSAQREMFSWHCGLFQRWCGMASLITRFEHMWHFSMWLS